MKMSDIDNHNNDHATNNNEHRFSVAVVDFAAEDAPKKLTDSLKSTGFAVLTNTPVSNDLIQDVYSEWREFMIRLNKDSKKQQEEEDTTIDTNTNTNNNSINLAQKYYLDMHTQDGYFPTAVSETAKGATTRDLKHYYQCYFPHGRYPDDEVSGDARLLWRSLVDLGKTLVGWIDEHLPADIRATIEKKIGAGTTLSDCVSDEQTMLRILHYPGEVGGDSSTSPVGAVRAAAHEDINLITVLPAGSARGLQVRSNQSGEWFEVPLVPGSIVINVGDMMQEMTDHAYISTTHRVIKIIDDDDDDRNNNNDNNNDDSNNKGNNNTAFGSGDRMSTPCFIHLKKKCPMSDKYGSANHYLYERLVTLGVIPPVVLENFLAEFPDGIMPGWDPSSE